MSIVNQTTMNLHTHIVCMYIYTFNIYIYIDNHYFCFCKIPVMFPFSKHPENYALKQRDEAQACGNVRYGYGGEVQLACETLRT